MASKATTDLLLIAAIVGGGYLILKTTKLGEAIGGVGEGVGEAVEGVGAGVGIAGRGLGAGVAELSGQVTSITGDVAELTAFIGEWGLGIQQEIREIRERSIREHLQETEVDIAAFEAGKAELAEIQTEKERILAEEEAKRSKLITEEKTQFVEAVTTFPEKFTAGLRAMWEYSPTKLLSSWIAGVVSVEEEAAPQQSAPTTSGAAAPAPSGTTEELVMHPSGVCYLNPELAYTSPMPVSEPESEPEPTLVQKATSFILKTFAFFR